MTEHPNGMEKEAGKALKNPWIIVAGVLLIILIGVVVFNSTRGISKTKAGETLVNFINANFVQDSSVELKDVEDLGDLYQVNVSYKGQEIPVYITKDGKYFVQSAIEIASITGLASSTKSNEVPKSDKPKVEAFVFSYCPYGLQFEKVLLPVYDLLKNKADINLVQIGAMHGEYEKIEALRQLCIQKEYGKDMLWKYLAKFIVNTTIGNCGSNIPCSTPLVEQIMKGLNIDVTKINACMNSTGESLYNADNTRAQELGISGSPTFVINNVDVLVERNPEAIKQAICSAFNKAPEECNQNLSSSAATPGFGISAGESTSARCG